MAGRLRDVANPRAYLAQVVTRQSLNQLRGGDVRTTSVRGFPNRSAPCPWARPRPAQALPVRPGTSRAVIGRFLLAAP
ncbi:hypothetical protein ACWEV3_04525 [Saccharopolyspora sp. NPDC003752]